ncbi:MAG: agmatinase [Actinomycetota bacterium]
MGDREFRIDEGEEPFGDDEYTEFTNEELPSYVGSTSFQKRPVCDSDEALAASGAEVAIVGAPLDDGASNRPGARFGPRAIRQATYHSGDLWSIQLETEVFSKVNVVDAGDAPVVASRLNRGLRVIHEKVFRVASTGAIPIVFGGDHSITYPSAAAIARACDPRKVGVVHFDAHADTGHEVWGSLVSHGTPMRRLIEEGWIAGKNFVQVGLRGYWPEAETFAWMQEQEMRWHRMVEIEERGAEAVIADAIAEALDGPDCVYLSIDVDVVDPGMAPGTGTPEPGGMLGRELLRAVRQIVGAVDLVGMDIVEVSPPFDNAEVTAALAHRCALEAISALAKKKA